MPAAVHGPKYLAELQADPDYDGAFVFTEDDKDTYIELLNDALTSLDPDQVNVFYLCWSFGEAPNKNLLREWLASIEPFVEAGRAE